MAFPKLVTYHPPSQTTPSPRVWSMFGNNTFSFGQPQQQQQQQQQPAQPGGLFGQTTGFGQQQQQAPAFGQPQQPAQTGFGELRHCW